MKNTKSNTFMQMKNNSGFTLIELVLVLIIIVVLASVTIANFSSWQDNIYLKSAARDLYSSMQEARMIAVENNSSTAIVFDTANNRYYLCDDPGADGWDGANDYTGTGDNNILRTVDLAAAYNNRVRFGPGNVTAGSPGSGDPLPPDNISYSSPVNILTVNSKGIGNGGYAYLENPNQDICYAVGTRVSGLVKIWRWDGGAWQ
ncbi:GspH/FimT family protein [Desulfospira joergensenii]|uniref:GspH/FimT family protein n=1 Tax=Desulfospira joergensenii TaxID=53329 RepID=UPI0003B62D30|nr:GspH/FimT family protein [Desulfospira joergensenii]